MTLLLKNVKYIHENNFSIFEGHLLVEEGKNGKTTFLKEIPDQIQAETKILDLNHRYVSKSFVNGHHHVYSTLARGMPMPKDFPKNFLEILQKIWWKVDKALDLEMIKASAAFAAMEAAKNGVTFVIDHHASPSSIYDSLDTIAQTFDKQRINHLLCYEISDRDGVEPRDQGLEETDNYLKYREGLVGLHANFTVSDESLERAMLLVEKYHSGIHIHLEEDTADKKITLEKYGSTPTQRLKNFGALDSSKTILAHALHISKEERETIQNSKAWIVENIESNLNNKVGVFKGDFLGERIMLGTDGMHNDMIQSTQAAYFTGLNHEMMSPQTAYSRFRGADQYLKQNKINGHSSNNLVIFDYSSPTPLHPENFLGHFMYGLRSHHIESVISNGHFIVKDKIYLPKNENEIIAYAQEQAIRLWEKLK